MDKIGEAGKAFVEAWDSDETLPPIEFSDAEIRRLVGAVLSVICDE